MPGKLKDRYQPYCATYKIHAMATHHGGAGHTDEDRDLNSHVEDTRGIDLGSDNDKESANNSDTMIAFRGSDATGCLSSLLPNS